MTLQDTLRAVADLGVRLSVAENGKLHVDAPVGALTPDLRATLKKRKDEIIEACRARMVPTVVDDRDAIRKDTNCPDAAWIDEFEWASRLGPEDLPKAPFPLDSNRTVVDVAGFTRALQADVARGPQGPRARYGSVQADCRILRAIMNSENNQN